MIRKSKGTIDACTMLLALLVCAPAIAVDPAGEVRFKTLSVEAVYLLKITTYQPPLISPTDKKLSEGACAQDTPEGTISAYFEALRKVDVQRSKACWSAKSLVEMEARDAASGRGDEYWRARWNQTYAKGFDLAITRRGDYGAYAFVEYRVTDHLPKPTSALDNLALEREGGKWKLTQALAADPILQYWNTDDTRVQVTPLSWQPPPKK